MGLGGDREGAERGRAKRRHRIGRDGDERRIAACRRLSGHLLVNAAALMYHDVTPAGREDASGFPGGDAARYKLTPAQFDDHLAAIRLKVNRPVDVIEAVDLEHGPAPLLLTFDDGGASAMAIADRLERAGWRGHFFMTTAYVGRPGFLDAARLRELRRRGHCVGSHSHSHPLRMARLPIVRLRDEWMRSVATLADALGEPIHAASVPGGHHSSAVARAAADAGIRFLFTSEPTVRIRRVAGIDEAGIGHEPSKPVFDGLVAANRVFQRPAVIGERQFGELAATGFREGLARAVATEEGRQGNRWRGVSRRSRSMAWTEPFGAVGRRNAGTIDRHIGRPLPVGASGPLLLVLGPKSGQGLRTKDDQGQRDGLRTKAEEPRTEGPSEYAP